MGRARRGRVSGPPPPSYMEILPPEERPRYRILRGGGPVLSDPEILSLVLGGGSGGVCPLGLAREVLGELGGLFGLVGVVPEALRRRGLGEAKAAAVLAAVELGRRLAEAQVPERRPLERPAALARHLDLRYGSRSQEVLGRCTWTAGSGW